MTPKHSTHGKARQWPVILIVILLIGAAVLLRIWQRHENAAPQAANSPNTSSRLAAWQTKYGNTVAVLRYDGAAINNDANNTNYTAMERDCQKLRADATTAAALPALPFANNETNYRLTMQYYRAAAQECLSGGQGMIVGAASGDADTLDQAANQIQAATTALAQGSAEMDYAL